MDLIRLLRRWAIPGTSRLLHRGDAEHEQALLRILLATLIAGYFGVARLLDSSLALGTNSMPVAVFGGYFLIALVLAIEVSRNPGPSPRRRVIGLIADNAAITACMALSTLVGTPLFGMFLLVTFSNGFRFGNRYLLGSLAFSMAGFALVLAINPYWRELRPLGLGLLFTMALLSVYVAALIARTSRARAAAEAANMEKTRFLSAMSHEMRTPLNGVIGINGLLLDTSLTSEQRDLLRTSTSSAELLLSLVNNVLDIAKIEAGHLELESVEFDLHQLVFATVRPFELQAKTKQLALHVAIDPRISYRLRGSPLHLRQVLVNLISNAVKFTQAGSIWLRIRLAGEEPYRIRFEVEDTGIGIPSEARERIFERFYQADQSITRRYGGTGLGTTISRQLVSSMGGEIGVTSEVGRGSSFWFEVPLDHVAEHAGDLNVRTLAGLRMILLAVDSRMAAELRIVLERWGVEAHYVRSQADLLAVLAQLATQGQYAQLIVAEEFPRGSDTSFDWSALASKVHNVLPGATPMMVGFAPEGFDRPDGAKAEALRAGLAGWLGRPLAPRELFNALHAALVRNEPPIAVDSVFPVAPVDGVPDAAVARRSVLVAEDNPTNGMVIRKVLDQAGFNVTMVENGVQVLEVLERERFDVVIVDWHMPQMGGLDALRFYRLTEPANERLAFIMLTANATREAMEACQAAGFDAFLTKPIEPSRLLEAISKVTSIRLGRPERKSEASRESFPEDASGATQRTIASTVGWTNDPRGSSETTRSGDLVDLRQIGDLRRLAAGDSFFHDLVTRFIGDSVELLAAMRGAAASGRFAAVQEDLHAMKGSAGSVGAAGLYRKCEEISRAGWARTPQQVQQSIMELDATFEETKCALMLLADEPTMMDSSGLLRRLAQGAPVDL